MMLVDDHRLFTASLAMALRHRHFGVDTPALTSLADVATRMVEIRPDVAIVDRDLGTIGSGEPLLDVATAAHVPVIIVTATLNDVVAGRCYSRGAAACISKAEPLDSLLGTVAEVARGEQAVPRADRYRLIDVWRQWQTSTDAAITPFSRLTQREAAVLQALMDGCPVKAIAVSSGVAEATVRSQVRCILSKLGVSSQLSAVAMALRVGWSGQLGPAPAPLRRPIDTSAMTRD